MASSEVKAWEDAIVIPTYERGPEDPNPPLLMARRNPIHPGSSIIYPYPLQETLFNRKTDRKWRIFYLENAYLKLGLLPELGGRLAFLFNKKTNEEAIYHNHVLKWARIGIRGAWVSGGIEWNFPNGHTVTSSSPIDCAVRRNEDGSASLLFGDIERVSRMRWSVAVTLYPDRAFFETEMRLANRTVLPNRYWFWANSAAPVSMGMEYITTASKVFTLKDVMSFPVHDGTDIHWDKNHAEAQDMFCLNPREEFVGWYNHDLKKGMINVADRTEARGTKFFTWGGSDDGAIWGERLTDADGPYAEMQSGRFPTMGIWEILSPCSEESWKEVWYPVTQIGAPVFANREAAFALSRPKTEAKRAGVAKLGVLVTRPTSQARLVVQIADKVVWQRQLDLAPETPYQTELPAAAGVAGKDLSVTLTGASGEILARWVRRAKREPERPVKGYIKIEPTRPGRRAEEQWLNGRDFEKLGDFQRASDCYREALKTEPGFSPALIGMGVLNLRRGLYAQAMEHFQNVLLDDPASEAARFYLAACHLDNEQFTEAIEELKAVMRSRPFRAGASALLGGLYIGQGELAKAIEQLDKCTAQFPWNQEAVAFLACALRRQGERRKAQALVDRVLVRDPLHFLSLTEAWLLADRSSAATKRLTGALRGEVQSYLETACDYARVGLYPEACDLLALYFESCGEGQADAMACYHLAYYTEKLGRKESRGLYRQARLADPAFVFPHRLESERILRRALKVNPQDGRARYYLGNLLCAKGRPEEAIAWWEQSLESEKGFSVLHRNLGRAYWKVCHDPDRAIAQYRVALQCSPMDYKLYYELDCILVDCGLGADRRELMASVPPELMDNDVIAERMAMFHADHGDFDRALQILRSGYFYPWEIYRGVRVLYVDALIGKGLQLEQANKYRLAAASYRQVLAYPRNIGVGEPYYKANAEALYRIGLALERDKDKAGAQRHWQQAAREKHAGWSALDYYRARALQKLGQRKEAGTLLAGLLDWARKSLQQGRGSIAESHYLAGLALKGKGERANAQCHFRAALAADAGHRRARWEVGGFTAE